MRKSDTPTWFCRNIKGGWTLYVTSNKGANITYTWWSHGTELDNIFNHRNLAGNIKPDKEKSTEKIDGAVATIMVLDRAIRCVADNSEPVYDQRGILLI